MLSLVVVVNLQGCSWLLLSAVEKTRTPIVVGAHRGEVERTLGPPTATRTLTSGAQTATYRHRTLYTPSSGIWSRPDARLQAYMTIDVGTVFFAEVINFPLEVYGLIYRSIRGTTQTISVVYGEDDRVVSYQMFR
jgi:hypothetical protein